MQKCKIWNKKSLHTSWESDEPAVALLLWLAEAKTEENLSSCRTSSRGSYSVSYWEASQA